MSLRALGSDLDALDEAVAAMFGLHRTDLRCLEIVGRGGPLSAGALAEQAGLSTSAVTSVIDRAEQSGDLRRLSDPQDRRRVLVEVTEHGRRRGRAAFSGLQQGTDQILRRHSPEELRLLGTFVEEVRSVVAGEAARAVSAAAAARGQGTGRRSAR
jgi:DNA-binding MarR family transcriptional regulator